MNIDDLSPELKENAHACRTLEVLFELAKEEGMDIPDAELEGIAGGGVAWCDIYDYFCPSYCKEYVNPNCTK